MSNRISAAAMVHLENELRKEFGPDGPKWLFDPANLAEVKSLCRIYLIKELTNIGPENRSYDVLSYLEGGEQSVLGHTMVERARKMNANLGEDDGQYLLDHQDEIPETPPNTFFVFPDWHYSDSDDDEIYCIDLDGDLYTKDHSSLNHANWCGWGRVLRRKK